MNTAIIIVTIICATIVLVAGMFFAAVLSATKSNDKDNKK